MSHQAPVSDEELIRGIQSGFPVAGEDLFEKYAARVYYLALRKLGSHADAEDVRSETFLRVLRAIQDQQVRSPESLSLFILGAAHNVILELNRNRQRVTQTGELADLPSPRGELPADRTGKGSRFRLPT